MLFIMKKLNKKVLNSSLVIILALGLGGCAVNSTTTTHQDSARSAKVTKQSSKKSTKTSNKAESSSNKAAATYQSESTAVSHQASTDVNGNTASQQSNTNTTSFSTTSNATTSIVSQNTTNAQRSSAPQAQQEIQLGLGEVASWTDSQGTTHHVDSDGMDRYTTKGSQEVQYQDWSGSLPQNATVNHQN